MKKGRRIWAFSALAVVLVFVANAFALAWSDPHTQVIRYLESRGAQISSEDSQRVNHFTVPELQHSVVTETFVILEGASFTEVKNDLHDIIGATSQTGSADFYEFRLEEEGYTVMTVVCTKGNSGTLVYLESINRDLTARWLQLRDRIGR